MQALYLPDALIVPARGVVDGTRRVQSIYELAHLRRVELTPAFVERHPHRDAGAVIEMPHHRAKLRAVL